MRRLLIYILFVGILVGCTSNKNDSQGDGQKIRVVATTGMLYDAVINIGKEKVDAEALMGPGVDPHLYKASQGDLNKFRNADLIVYNGIFLEGKMSDILKKLGKQKPVLAAAETIPKDQLLNSNDYEDMFDPHVWFDISKWKIVVREIGSTLGALDTANTLFYQRNTQAYLLKLDSLEMEVKQQIANVPEDKRILVTSHDAFGYFGKAYGFQVKGIQGISTVEDFGLKDIAEIIDLIIANDIRSIFVETSVSNKSVNAVIVGCREKGHDVEIGGTLFSDAMGEFGTTEGTYIGMVSHNVKSIVNGLR
jgi:manganese/zinc/iron transport system substrate-binding protein